MNPEYLAALCGLVTLAGIIASFRAMASIAKEKKNLDIAESQLNSSAVWEGAKVDDPLLLDQWIASQQIEKSSHVSSIIHTAWLSWYLGRPANAVEFHANISRKERKRHSARIASGIAATLLVLGIVSTLWCVKDVLQAFQIEITTDGNVASAAKNAGEANDLMRDLAGAFLPSMVALIGTILVVITRGFYASKLHHLVVELDELTDTVILPRFRLAPVTVQFENIIIKLHDLASKIQERDLSFGKAVTAMEKWTTNLDPSITHITAATNACSEAASKLTNNSDFLSKSLDRNFGENSQLMRALSNLDFTYSEAQSVVNNASAALESIELDRTAAQAALSLVIQESKSGIESIPSEIERQCKIAGDASIEQFADLLEAREDKIIESTDIAAKKAAGILNPTVESIRTSAHSIHQDLSSSKESSKEVINIAMQSMQEIAKHSKRMDDTQLDVKKSIDLINHSLGDVKSSIAIATEELKHTLNLIPKISKDLNNSSQIFNDSEKIPQQPTSRLLDTEQKSSAKIDPIEAIQSQKNTPAVSPSRNQSSAESREDLSSPVAENVYQPSSVGEVAKYDDHATNPKPKKATTKPKKKPWYILW